LCGFLPSSKMFPIMGNGCGPGGSLVEFWVWFNFLSRKIRMLAHIKVITSIGVWYSMTYFVCLSFFVTSNPIS
jgi:hypothetical protein